VTQAPLAFEAWRGRCEQVHDTLSATPARALAATLDRPDEVLRNGDSLAPLFHWLYFLPIVPMSRVGADGHPQRGDFLPPVPLPRRMWAAGRLRFLAPLRIGEPVTRHSEIIDIRSKQGRSGSLVFVTVRHRYKPANGEVALVEEQDLVYRDAPTTGADMAQSTEPLGPATWSRDVVADPVLLFRYSALTFNGHRIHYDRSYATEVEGYPGLVVHGPLLATLLLDLLRRERPGACIESFEFRAVRPLFDGAALRLRGSPAADGRGVRLWAEDAVGALCMTASATLD